MCRRACTVAGTHLPTARPAIMHSPTHSVRYRSKILRRFRPNALSIQTLRRGFDSKLHQHPSCRKPVAGIQVRAFQTFLPSVVVHCCAPHLSDLSAVVHLVTKHLPGHRLVEGHLNDRREHFAVTFSFGVHGFYLLYRLRFAFYARPPCDGLVAPMAEYGFHSLTVQEPFFTATLKRSVSS